MFKKDDATDGVSDKTLNADAVNDDEFADFVDGKDDTPKKSEREIMMEKVAANAIVARDEEEDLMFPDKAEERKAAEEAEAAEKAAAEAGDKTKDDDDTDKLITVKVDGKEEKLTQKELNEKIQKESSFVDLINIEIGKVIIGQKYLVESLL